MCAARFFLLRKKFQMMFIVNTNKNKINLHSFEMPICYCMNCMNCNRSILSNEFAFLCLLLCLISNVMKKAKVVKLIEGAHLFTLLWNCCTCAIDFLLGPVAVCLCGCDELSKHLANSSEQIDFQLVIGRSFG